MSKKKNDFENIDNLEEKKDEKIINNKEKKEPVPKKEEKEEKQKDEKKSKYTDFKKLKVKAFKTFSARLGNKESFNFKKDEVKEISNELFKNLIKIKALVKPV